MSLASRVGVRSVILLNCSCVVRLRMCIGDGVDKV